MIVDSILRVDKVIAMKIVCSFWPTLYVITVPEPYRRTDDLAYMYVAYYRVMRIASCGYKFSQEMSTYQHCPALTYNEITSLQVLPHVYFWYRCTKKNRESRHRGLHSIVKWFRDTSLYRKYRRALLGTLGLLCNRRPGVVSPLLSAQRGAQSTAGSVD